MQAMMQATVTSVVPVASGILQLGLVPDAGGAAVEVAPGAHIDLHLPNGLIRQYSLLGSSTPQRFDVAVNLDPNSRGGSAAVHKILKAGDRLAISAPRNHFPLCETAAHSVLVAGGIGVTPIHAMVHRLAELGQGWTLYHCARNPERTPYMAELRNLAARSGGTLVHIHDGIAGVRPLDLAAVVEGAPEGAHFYCCGPSPLMAAFADATAGLPAARVHVEYFAAPAPASEASGDTASAFELVLARSGKVLQIPADRSILEALEAEGIAPLCSCREGICGTCETAILSGEPDHRDLVLSPDERAANATMMICVSRARSASLTLDL